MAKKLDPQAFGTKSMSQRDVMGKAMAGATKATTMFGSPKKMSPQKIAQRKRTMISNAATKAMSSKYSR